MTCPTCGEPDGRFDCGPCMDLRRREAERELVECVERVPASPSPPRGGGGGQPTGRSVSAGGERNTP